MSRQSLLDYLTCKTDTYEHSEGLSLSTGGGDFQPVGPPLCERPPLNSGYDVFGVHWSRAIPASHYTQGQEPIIKDIENWREEVRFPIVDKFPWDLVAMMGQSFDRENKVIMAVMLMGPFERTTSLTSFEDCLVNAVSDPEDYKALVEAIADYKIDIINHLYQAVKPDIITLHDDWGTGLNTFFRPELWRETIRPATQRIYDTVHGLGMLVGQHSCGKLGPLVDDMVEMGANVWEAQGSANDLEAINAKYGDRLRILDPPVTGFEFDANAASAPEPDPETLPPSWRPYKEVPEFLYS